MAGPYTLADVCVMTRITERTLRKHIASGTLRGEKVQGCWRFSMEEVAAFLNRPEVRRLIAAHYRAVADDFLNARIKPRPASLCVLDMPDADESFLARVLTACEGLEMTYAHDRETGMTRVTLSGDPKQVSAALAMLEVERP